jgi:hypothetical protein
MAEFACRACGYSLDGVARAHSPVTCPECGREYADAPRALPPMPNTVMVALRLMGPCLGAVALLVLASQFRGTRNLFVWPFLLIWALAMLWGVVFAPWVAADGLAGRHVIERRRRAVRGWLALIGLLANLGVVGIGAVLFRLF